MNPKFNKGDVVEILNVNSSQMYNLGKEEAQNLIGMRFNVDVVLIGDTETEPAVYGIFIESSRHHVHMNTWFYEAQLLLYHRNPISRFKNLFR